MFYQIIAIVGAGLVLGAYAALQRGVFSADDRLFNLMNLVGAWLLTWVAVVDRRWGFIALEFTWGLLSIPPLLRGKKSLERQG